mmetsp:Transcript_27599/g.70307  ORF Transcript_27599/g.70307 Transcript_27599/m.70307 type:complete len:175 (-) Transcript_27599:537-1061(-)|eukprot:CAMPEP_0202866518 /NCGR_PEP_ID=MMETSP1391-20130828/7808_1 /ASSEMBLY_ACC=CAM_ASM_000867 /TAXON_ID=1034604 /ORGANISM="Chlamydomonas leiostraca, Strain SAG 11-49" /LENGTH=174 /DNA_ID=CAMNT_0049546473 /DNA_START=126 /DNA_END=650 /DNA_ORIENTATION=+
MQCAVSHRAAHIARPIHGNARVAKVRCQASVDPQAKTGLDWKPGKIVSVHGPADLDQVLKEHNGKLCVLMCKASHCKPCMKFLTTYRSLAERFSDAVLMTITGDETPDTRKMMMERKVKVTPTFFLYRNGATLHTLTGTTSGALRDKMLDSLLATEAGREWHEPVVSASDDDDD